MVPIETSRLRLVPYAAEHLLALIEGEDCFAQTFGSPAAAGLRSFIVSEDVSPVWLEQLRASTGADPFVHGFAVILRERGAVIGNVGFTGPPDGKGVVEIAYAIVPAWQGRGYATEAADAGVAFAFDDGRVRIVRAHTLPEMNASTSVLTKCGFEHAGEIEDPGDGPVWRWERGPQGT